MHEIEVRTISTEEASAGVAELWRDGEQIAYTLYDISVQGGDLMLHIEPREDGSPLVIEVNSLAKALAEVDRALVVS
jgi:hypothetical protein